MQLQKRSGYVFVFRGRRGDLIKLLWWDGDGLCLFAKRLERGRFIWPQATEGSIHLTGAQLAMLLEGIDWRRPERTWKPQKSRINSGLWGCSQRPQSRKLSPCLRPTHCPTTPLCSRRWSVHNRPKSNTSSSSSPNSVACSSAVAPSKWTRRSRLVGRPRQSIFGGRYDGSSPAGPIDMLSPNGR